MSGRLSKTAMPLLRALVQRGPRRCSWAYLLWLVAYVPPMVWLAGDLSFEVRPHQLLPVLVPIGVVVVQLVYPTWLGWAVILIPSVLFAGVGVVSVIITAPARDLPRDLAAVVISSIAAVVYVLICVALWFARPRPEAASAPRPTDSGGKL